MKKIFFIRFYEFEKVRWGSLKNASKYFLTIKLFNKWSLDFRILNQDGSFYFRNEQFYHWLKSKKNQDVIF